MDCKNVLILGNGGRESAIGWKIKKDNPDINLFFMNGNAGTLWYGDNIEGDYLVGENVEKIVNEKNIDLVIIGPEQPLFSGVSDYLRDKNIPVFGPSSHAAILETSKVFAKEFMKKYGVPTAEFEIAETPEEAMEIIKKYEFPVVIKADGLAAGKGVKIAEDLQDAEKAIDDIMVKKIFGESGNRVVIEKFLHGKELSVFVITDGKNYTILPFSRDYKRIYDGNKGPNTGGMGSYAPVKEYSQDLKKKIEDKIVKVVIENMNKENRKYQGVLYCGLMIDENENPYVIEFNARFGDPETQSIMPLIKTNLLEIFYDIATDNWDGSDIEIYENKCAVTVILSSEGYPGKYPKGMLIEGLNERKALEEEDILLFVAGAVKKDGAFYTSGGRVIGICGIDETMEKAREKSYRSISLIKFDGMYYRKDIAMEAQ